VKRNQASGWRSEEHKPAVAERVEQILRSRGLALAEVSRQTASRYAGAPHFFIPHNFYYDLGIPGYSPKIQQIAALSRISNYRLADWLTVFGYDLAGLARLQVEFPPARTSLIDATLYDPAAWIPWFADAASDKNPPSVTPLGQLLVPTQTVRAAFFRNPTPSPFLYAKIGREDALAFPDLLPGSIVRADSRVERIKNAGSARIFLVEHARGIVCCRLRAKPRGRVTLRSAALPFAEAEFRLGSEARILGMVDWELRSCKTERSEVPTTSPQFLNPPALRAPATLLEILERARVRGGFSFRSASAKSRWLAETQGDSRYFCASSSLAGYEKNSRLPAHIHKILSLCILYSLGFWELLRAAGFAPDDLGQEAMPDALAGRAPPASSERTETSGPGAKDGFLTSLLKEFEEIPLLLRRSLSTITDLPDLSLRDLFWTGGTSGCVHPLLKDAVFVSVNRRLKRPRHASRQSLWDEPLYLLLMRDGTYRLAGCAAEGHTLLVDWFRDGSAGPERLRGGVDAEIVGKVTAVFRRLR
jgi:hypothetical protein